MKTTRILVTGASGFVGSTFCRRFASRDDLEIRGLGRRAMNLPGYMQADLRHPLEMDWKPDVIIHAAALASPWGSRRQFHESNVLATQHVCAFAEACAVRRLVYVSSSSVFYREKDQRGLTEESPIGPNYVNEYARTKREGECIARNFVGESLVMRPRAVFGPGDTVLFPRLLRAAREGRMVIITRRGPPVVGDLIAVDALCEYLLQAALQDGLTGDFNVTNNEPVEMQEFIAEIFRRLGLPLPQKKIPRERALALASIVEWVYRVAAPHREPPITRFGVGALAFDKTFDVTKALSVFGPPTVSLAETLDRFVEWQKREAVQ